MTNRKNFSSETISASPTHSSTRHLNHLTSSFSFASSSNSHIYKRPYKAIHEFHMDSTSHSSSNASLARRSIYSTRNPIDCPSYRSTPSQMVRLKMSSLLYIFILFLIVSNAFQLVTCRRVSGANSKYQGKNRKMIRI